MENTSSITFLFSTCWNDNWGYMRYIFNFFSSVSNFLLENVKLHMWPSIYSYDAAAELSSQRNSGLSRDVPSPLAPGFKRRAQVHCDKGCQTVAKASQHIWFGPCQVLKKKKESYTQAFSSWPSLKTRSVWAHISKWWYLELNQASGRPLPSEAPFVRQFIEVGVQSWPASASINWEDFAHFQSSDKV